MENYDSSVDNNYKQIEDIKKTINFNKLFQDLEVRLSVVESIIKMLLDKKIKREKLIQELSFGFYS
ncbi:hypothetical protein J4429_02680 [Candidatus Pacearchaeota archaeon]|nr:hypothetical protein [Candidatus Pacearchaeota archaeon]